MESAAKFASLDSTEALRIAGSSIDGLSPDEAERRLHVRGKNRLPRAPRLPLVRRILNQLFNPLILILVAVAILTPLIGHPTDAIIIFIVLACNTTIGIVQEGRASRSLEALEHAFVHMSVVRRGGREYPITSEDIVPGDIVLLQEGNMVPADGRILESRDLRIDESALTGESIPVDKTSTPLRIRESSAIGDIANCAFRQTHVVAGHGLLLVLATGQDTEVGRIATELTHAQTKPPLVAKVQALSRTIALVVMSFSAVLFLFGIATGRPPLTLFATVISLAVSIIPEGLPIVLTLVLSRGVSHMAAKRAVVKKLHAVEGLGHVDVICTDKTGTLTTNTLVVEHAWAMTDQLLLGAALVGTDGDPINAALHTYARDHGVTPEGWRLVDERAFEYQTRSRRTRFEQHGVYRSFIIGSPEHILETSDLTANERARIQDQILRAAREGLRIIALASRDNDQSLDDSTPWQFAGFVGMSDTLRPRVIESVAWCRAEGIRVVMITGDHPDTAFAIAQHAGIADPGDRVLSGYELELMTDDTLASLLDEVRVFARISPTHKLRIVNAYRAAGLITAMTGDGVNDAPALHRADIGIAMGKQGTDVAREASHLVLMDDNFATIIDAIKEGRSTIANVRRVISYLGSTSIAEAGIITIALLAGLPLPLLPGQIIWINLVTDTFLDVSLGMEPAHGSHGEHRGALIDRRSILRMILLGSTMAIGTFAISHQFGYTSTAHLQTLTLTTLAVFQWFNAWNARSEHQSLRSLSPLSNTPLLASTGIVIGLQLLAVYAPPFQALLGTTPLSGSDWILILEFACTVILVDEGWKALQRRRSARPPSS